MNPTPSASSPTAPAPVAAKPTFPREGARLLNHEFEARQKHATLHRPAAIHGHPHGRGR